MIRNKYFDKRFKTSIYLWTNIWINIEFEQKISKVETNNKEVYVYNSNNSLIGYGGVSNSSPLPNFYSSEFFFDGHKLMFVESAIMYIKAISFNDHKIASKLL